VARRIIIDCDPGQDDAVALFLAMWSPDELDILGITKVAGNVPLSLTQGNARVMCDISAIDDVPVFAGCERPMVLDPITAEYIHGNTGIDGVDAFEPQTPLQEKHAVDFIVESLLKDQCPGRQRVNGADLRNCQGVQADRATPPRPRRRSKP